MKGSTLWTVIFMDCYEIEFVFANVLLCDKKQILFLTPRGDGKSLIFDPNYSKLSADIVYKNRYEDVGDYCRIYLDLLKAFKNHPI